MGLVHLFKLEKLKISVFGNRRRLGLPQDSFKVMYNPETFSMSHENEFQKLQGITTNVRRAMYSYSRSDQLTVDLMIDGTGVADYGLVKLIGLGTKSVADQIDDLPAFEFAGQLRFRKEALDRWMEERERLRRGEILARTFRRRA